MTTALAFFILNLTASADAAGPAALPDGWAYHDLAHEPVLALALGGARATMTYADRSGQTIATVRVYRSRVLKAPWPDRVATWTKRLVGSDRVVVTKAARLDVKNGARRYLIETQSDGDGDQQLHTILLAIEYRNAGQTRLQLFSFEDTRDINHAGAPAVRALFGSLKAFPL